MTSLTRAMTAVGSAPRFAITAPTTLGPTPFTSAAPPDIAGWTLTRVSLASTGSCSRSSGVFGPGTRPSRARSATATSENAAPAARSPPAAENRRAGRPQLCVGGLDDHLFALAAQRRHLGDPWDPDQRGA